MRLGDFRFDPTLNELTRDGATQRLPKRLGELLARLAREPNQLVKRETLLDEVWERRHVNEEVLSRAIADLRIALGDDARQPRYIETLPKLGYRLVCAVGPDSAEVAAAAVRRRRRIVTPVSVGGAALVVLAAIAVQWFALPRKAAPAHLTAERLLHARPFTSDPGRELHPRFTPDARWVVYTRFVPDAGPAQLRLRAIDGTEDRALVQDEHDNACGSVSPDGGQLLWLRTRGERCEVMLRDLLGGAARVVADCGVPLGLGCPDWRPDGRSVVFEGGRDAPGLRELNLADGQWRTLTAPPGGNHDLMPRIAPDGSVVFWRAEADARRALRLPRDGGEPLELGGGAHLAFGHAFDTDGTPISADDRFGQRGLVRHGADGAELLGAPGARYPDIASNGALVYEVAHYDANLWRIDLRDPAAPPRQLTRAARYDSQPALSPDGAWLAFGSNRDGREGVYLMRADGRDERKLPLDPAQRWTSPAWSADGSALIVLRYTETEASACRHELATAATACPPGLARDRNGAFALAAGDFGAVDEATRDAALWRHRFDGTPAERIDTAGAVDRCRASATHLACHRPGEAGLWLQDRATGVATAILPELGAGLRAWDLTGDAVWFPRGGEARGLWRYDLASAQLVRVHDLVPTAIGDALSVSRDGGFAIVARTDALDVDLMLLAPQQKEEKGSPDSGR